MFENKEGQAIPQVTFKTRQNNEWKDVTSDDIFSDKTVIVFSLPGALRQPVHLPMYRALTNWHQHSMPMVWTPSSAYQ